MSAPIAVSQSTDADDFSANTFTSSGLAMFLLPVIVSLNMTSELSFSPLACCIRVPAAFIPPAEIMLLPPVIGCFSRRMTFAPASCAEIAAV